jgi:hypothetical protein
LRAACKPAAAPLSSFSVFILEAQTRQNFDHEIKIGNLRIFAQSEPNLSRFFLSQPQRMAEEPEDVVKMLDEALEEAGPPMSAEETEELLSSSSNPTGSEAPASTTTSSSQISGPSEPKGIKEE